MTELQTDAPDLDAIRSEADAILADRDGPYWDSNHLRHDAAVKKVTTLMSQLHGDKPAFEDSDTGSQTPDFHDQFGQIMAPAESPDAYDFSDVSLGEDEVWNEETEVLARNWLHRLGAGEAEGKAFAARYSEFRKLDAEALGRMPMETERTLRGHWGDAYEDNVAMARALVMSVGPEFMEFLTETGMGNDHATILALHRAAMSQGELK